MISVDSTIDQSKLAIRNPQSAPIATIDIIIPTYNRPSDIENFIDEILKQTYSNFRVFIIDDHGDEIVEYLVPKNDNRFYFERLVQNKGQAYVRNYALKKGKAPIVIFMDDDAWFLDNDALYRVISYFERQSDMGCLMFDILEPEREWLSKRFKISDRQELGEFIACGVAFRRQAIEAIGGFSTFLHSYGEETDMAMRLINKNYKLHFAKEVQVFHNYRPGERDSRWFKRFKFNSVRNDLLIVFMRYPALLVIPYFVLKPISHFKFSIFNKAENSRLAAGQILAAFLIAIKMLPKALQNRNALSLKKFRYWKKVRF